MKHLLFTTTAIVTASVLMSGSAFAADKVKMSVGGYMQAFFVVADQDDNTGEPGANRRNHGLSREGEIIFNGKTTFDNGLQVGVQVQLEAETCSDQIDESFMWFSGSFGRINIGSENAAPYLMQYAAPSASHWAHGLNSPNFMHVSVGAHASGRFPTTRQLLASDAEKFTYFTPRLAGFQFGVSYTPDRCEEAIAGSVPIACGGSYAGLPSDVNNIGEIYEVAFNYLGNFSDVAVRLSAGYGTGEDEVGGAGRQDPDEYSIGGQVALAGFTVGGAYKKRNNVEAADGVDRTDANVGVRFDSGPWGVGIQYAYVDADSGTGSDEMDAFEVGGSFALGPGVVLSAGIQYFDFEDDAGDPANENEAVIAFIGTHIAY